MDNSTEEKKEEEGRKLITLFEDKGAITLKQQSVEVDIPLKDDDLALVNDLLQYVITHDGLGMAAIQLGEARRIFVMENPVGSRRLQVVINPVIHSASGKRKRIENCFSVPLPAGQGVMVRRPSKILVSYHDEDGNLFNYQKLQGALAQVFLHEYTHLNGHTILDDSPYGESLGIVRQY